VSKEIERQEDAQSLHFVLATWNMRLSTAGIDPLFWRLHAAQRVTTLERISAMNPPNRSDAHRSVPRLRRAGAFFTFIALLLLLFAGKGRVDDRLDPRLAEPIAKAVLAASSYLDRGDVIDALLKFQLGYDHLGIAENDWREFPAVYKVETAYLSAEATVPKNGERFLALLAKALAQSYPNAGNDPDLKAYINKANEDKIDKVKFARIAREPDSAPPELTKEAMNAVDTVTRYCEGGPFGLRAILIDHFGLEPREAYQILRTNRSPKDVLVKAVIKVGEERANLGMIRVVAFLDENYLNPRNERILNYWRKPVETRTKEQHAALEAPFKWFGPHDPRPWDPGFDGPRPPDFSGGGGGVGGGGRTPPPLPQIREQWRSVRATEYRHFTQRIYNAPKPGAFNGVRMGGRGFGGIIFGDDVTDTGPPEVKAIRWKKDEKDPKFGALIAEFEAQTASLPRVGLEDVYAAYLIYYQGINAKTDAAKLEPANAGEAVGLVGIESGLPYYECGPQNLVRKGTRWNVIMHPAIADLKLGWSILMCDVLPFPEMRPPILKTLESSDGEKTKNAILAEWEAPGKYTWKYTDVPIRISIEGDRLILERPKAKEFSQELRRSAFITFNTYSKALGDTDGTSDIDEGSGDRFYPVVPALLRASADYERLNNFARVCAVVRWAKSRGAKFRDRPDPPPPTPKAASLIITNAGAVPAPEFDRASAVKEQKQKVELRLATLHIKRPELMDLDKELSQIEEEVRRQESIRDEGNKSLQKAISQFTDDSNARMLILETKDERLLEKFEAIRKETAEGLEKLEKKITSQEFSRIFKRLTELTEARRKLLTESVPKLRDLGLEIERLELKVKEADMLAALLRLSDDPYALYVKALAQKTPDAEKPFAKAQEQLAEAEKSLREVEAKESDARAKLNKLLDSDGLPKNASAEAKNKYRRLRNGVSEVQAQKYSQKWGSDGWKAAEAKEKEANDRLREFEQTGAPDVVHARAQINLAVVAVNGARRSLELAKERLHQQVRGTCPDIDYWWQLRMLRANPLNWLLLSRFSE
jgi:hypothetical protein